jgi:hypothetical protein
MEDSLMGLGNDEVVNGANNAASRFVCEDGHGIV